MHAKGVFRRTLANASYATLSFNERFPSSLVTSASMEHFKHALGAPRPINPLRKLHLVDEKKSILGVHKVTLADKGVEMDHEFLLRLHVPC